MIRYLTMKQLADKLGYEGEHAANTARKWALDRGLPRFARSGKRITVRDADVDRAMEGQAYHEGGPR